MTVTVIIPTYKPDEKFGRLMKMLGKQTYPVQKILILNTEKAYWKAEFCEGIENIEVHHISREEFDHGGTRAMGADLAESDIVMYFTQDAVPENEKVIENLVHPFEDRTVGAVYGRQLPNKDCTVIETYTRSFNYPKESRKKTKEDLPELGIKTFFCSDVCAAYRKSIYQEMGGFSLHTIFNEDMIMAAQMIEAGYAVFYAAEAMVVHSHNYGWLQQFRRNFDLAVSQAEHPEIFEGISSSSEGIRLVKKTAVYLLKSGRPWLLPELVISSGFKFLGYKTGKNYRRLSEKMIKKCTMNPAYWKK